MIMYLIGELAVFGSLTRPRNFVATIVLIVGGITYGSGHAQVGTGNATTEESPKVRQGHAPTIEPYRLDMSTGDLSKLVELTPAEKRAFKRDVDFKGERIYHAPPANFAGSSCKASRTGGSLPVKHSRLSRALRRSRFTHIA
jgi:hypothetical protein